MKSKRCCYYEYARASETLRKARLEFNPADPDNSSLRIFKLFPPWVRDVERFCLWQCNSFPKAAWRDVIDGEREDFRLLFRSISPWPIITDLSMLKSAGVFDAFTRQADRALDKLNRQQSGTREWKRWRRRMLRDARRQPTIVSSALPSIKHVVITIDYRDGVDVKKKQILEWLDSGPNQKLFKDYYKEPMHKQNPDSPARYKELLKFLAAWRLHDELNFKAAALWTRENRRHKDHHPQPFFREKARKTPTGKRYRGPLFKEPRQWEAAITKAKSFLTKEIEFHQSADVGSR